MTSSVTFGPLSNCPFCGKGIPVVQILSAVEINCWEPDHPDHEAGLVQFAVVCDATRGGCGATGAYGESQAIAVKHWNRRTASLHDLMFKQLLEIGRNTSQTQNPDQS